MNKKEQAQVLTEFAMVMVIGMVLAIALMVLFYYFDQYGIRLLNLVSIDYP